MAPVTAPPLLAAIVAGAQAAEARAEAATASRVAFAQRGYTHPYVVEELVETPEENAAREAAETDVPALARDVLALAAVVEAAAPHCDCGALGTQGHEEDARHYCDACAKEQGEADGDVASGFYDRSWAGAVRALGERARP